MVLEIAKRIGDLGNHGFCLELVEMAARWDGDVENGEGRGKCRMDVGVVSRRETFSW